MKKGWKIGIIILVSILLIIGVWAGLIKSRTIPIDCKGQTFEYDSDIGIPTINGRKCKEGTYKKIIFTQRPGCPACQ